MPEGVRILQPAERIRVSGRIENDRAVPIRCEAALTGADLPVSATFRARSGSEHDPARADDDHGQADGGENDCRSGPMEHGIPPL